MIGPSLWHKFKAVGTLGFGALVIEKLLLGFCEGSSLPTMKEAAPLVVQVCIGWAAWLPFHGALQLL